MPSALGKKPRQGGVQRYDRRGQRPGTQGAASVLSGVVIVIDQLRVWDAIDRIAVPALLMWGDEDPLLERPMIDAVRAPRPPSAQRRHLLLIA